jgi:hypothetical protein
MNPVPDDRLTRAIILAGTIVSFPVGLAFGLGWLAVQYRRDRAKAKCAPSRRND